MAHQILVRVLPLPGVLVFRLNDSRQPRLLNQIPLILLERLELRNHIELYLTRRAEVCHRCPMHIQARAALRFDEQKVDEFGESRPSRPELPLLGLLIRMNGIHERMGDLVCALVAHRFTIFPYNHIAELLVEGVGKGELQFVVISAEQPFKGMPNN